MTERYELTAEHRAQLQPWADKWIANALRTEPLSNEEKDEVTRAIYGLYEAADLERPGNRVFFMPGPVSAAFAASIAAGVWHLRGDDSMFGKLTEEQLMDAARAAVAHCSAAATEETQHPARDTEEIMYRGVVLATNPEDTPVNNEKGEPLTEKAKKNVVTFLLECCRRHHAMRNGGNQWSGWVANLSFYRHIVKLPIDYSKWQHYETSAKAGPRYTHHRFCIVSDMPTTIGRDDQARSHCEHGPAIAWNDGTAAYNWHGTSVPRKLVEEPESYTRDEVRMINNSEIRRALAEKLGWDKYLELIDVDVVDQWKDPATGLEYELLEPKVRIGEQEPRYLKMRSPELNDGSRPFFIEPVHFDLRSAQAARKWQIQHSTDPAARYYRHGDIVVTYADPATLYWPSVEECNNNPSLDFVQET